MASVFKFKDFSPATQVLRTYFDQQFADPRALSAERFRWDYWHVPEQYTLLRTPAYEYFPQKIYRPFHHALVHWGRRNLGCWDVSPPWLSCYVEGCEQKLHCDLPHGAWAFVLSLSPRKQKFQGGETLIAEDPLLGFWQGTRKGSFEFRELMSSHPSRFNELLVFDPRRPHGVSRVTGTQDPREGRLVLHGWFSQPKTYIEGRLPAKATEKALIEVVNEIVDHMGSLRLWGTASVSFQVSSAGRASQVQFLTNTILDEEGQSPRTFLRKVLSFYANKPYPRAAGSSRVTVPLIFES